MGGPEITSRLELSGVVEPSEVRGDMSTGVSTELCKRPIRRLPALPPHAPLSPQVSNQDITSFQGKCAKGSISGQKDCQVNVAFSVSALYLPGKVEGQSVRYLVDSGCTLNLLSKVMFDKLSLKSQRGLEPFRCPAGTLADGSMLPFYGQVEMSGRLRSEAIKLTFVVADIEPEAILGMPFLQDNHCQLGCAESTLIMNGKTLRCTDRHGSELISKVQVISDVNLPPRSEKLISCRLSNPICSDVGLVESTVATNTLGVVLASSVSSYESDGKLVVRCLNPLDQKVSLHAGSVIGQCTSLDKAQLVEETQVGCVTGDKFALNSPDLQQPVPHHLEDLYQEATDTCPQKSQKQAIARLLIKYSDVFSSGESDMGLTDLVQHSIPVESGVKPIKQAPRRLGAEKEMEVDRQIQKLCHQGLIEPAHGAWSSPVVLVKKKDGTWRFCIDYRRLNAVTVHDAHPLPRIDESLEALAGSQYFSTLDLMSGYWQVPLDDDAKDKAAFCTRGGLWRWKVLPFGLTVHLPPSNV